jgi:transposase
VAKLRDVESSIRGILRGFGLKVGAIGKGRFDRTFPKILRGSRG